MVKIATCHKALTLPKYDKPKIFRDKHYMLGKSPVVWAISEGREAVSLIEVS
ncbi:MAG: hypothetical protein H7319_05810 [Spirosoma sp.]|nr:hypothetical protein [Spirosoma sp.]